MQCAKGGSFQVSSFNILQSFGASVCILCSWISFIDWNVKQISFFYPLSLTSLAVAMFWDPFLKVCLGPINSNMLPCYEAFMVELLSPAISARMWFDSRLRHNAPRWPGWRNFRIFSFSSSVTMDGNPAFTVHAVGYCACFQSSDETYSMLLRQQIWSLVKFLIFDGLTNFALKRLWCGSEGSYDDFYCGIFT